MPIYDYHCRQCGEEFELLVLKTTVVACPSCQSADLEQLLSGFSVASDERTRANVKAARRQYAGSANYKDQKVAEADEIREHAPQMFEKKKKP